MILRIYVEFDYKSWVGGCIDTLAKETFKLSFFFKFNQRFFCGIRCNLKLFQNHVNLFLVGSINERDKVWDRFFMIEIGDSSVYKNIVHSFEQRSQASNILVYCFLIRFRTLYRIHTNRKDAVVNHGNYRRRCERLKFAVFIPIFIQE